MNFKLEDFEINIIETPAKVAGGVSYTYAAGCTDGDQGCCDADEISDECSENTPCN